MGSCSMIATRTRPSSGQQGQLGEEPARRRRSGSGAPAPPGARRWSRGDCRARACGRRHRRGRADERVLGQAAAGRPPGRGPASSCRRRAARRSAGRGRLAGARPSPCDGGAGRPPARACGTHAMATAAAVRQASRPAALLRGARVRFGSAGASVAVVLALVAAAGAFLRVRARPFRRGRLVRGDRARRPGPCCAWCASVSARPALRRPTRAASRPLRARLPALVPDAGLVRRSAPPRAHRSRPRETVRACLGHSTGRAARPASQLGAQLSASSSGGTSLQGSPSPPPDGTRGSAYGRGPRSGRRPRPRPAPGPGSADDRRGRRGPRTAPPVPRRAGPAVALALERCLVGTAATAPAAGAATVRGRCAALAALGEQVLRDLRLVLGHLLELPRRRALAGSAPPAGCPRLEPKAVGWGARGARHSTTSTSAPRLPRSPAPHRAAAARAATPTAATTAPAPAAAPARPSAVRPLRPDLRRLGSGPSSTPVSSPSASSSMASPAAGRRRGAGEAFHPAAPPGRPRPLRRAARSARGSAVREPARPPPRPRGPRPTRRRRRGAPSLSLSGTAVIDRSSSAATRRPLRDDPFSTLAIWVMSVKRSATSIRSELVLPRKLMTSTRTPISWTARMAGREVAVARDHHRDVQVAGGLHEVHHELDVEVGLDLPITVLADVLAHDLVVVARQELVELALVLVLRVEPRIGVGAHEIAPRGGASSAA